MSKPVRLQLSRKKGFDLQAMSLATNGLPAVNVARPGEWGNPFTVKRVTQAIFHRTEWWVEKGASIWRYATKPEAATAAVALFKVHAESAGNEKWRERARLALQGKNLACWCKAGEACHAAVLLCIANPSGE